MTSLSKALAADARRAACWLLRLMPPDPKNSRTPARITMSPSKKIMSVAEISVREVR